MPAAILSIEPLRQMIQSIHLEYGILGEHVTERDPICGIQAKAIVPPCMPNGFEVFQACNTYHQVVHLLAHMLCLAFLSLLQSTAHFAEDRDSRGSRKRILPPHQQSLPRGKVPVSQQPLAPYRLVSHILSSLLDRPNRPHDKKEGTLMA